MSKMHPVIKNVTGVESLARATLDDIVQRGIGSSCMRKAAQYFLDNDLKALRCDMDQLVAKNSAMAVSELRDELARRNLPICILTRQVPGAFCGKPDTLCEYYFARVQRIPSPQLALPEVQ